MCVQKFSYLKMGQSLENTTFRYLRLSAVSFSKNKIFSKTKFYFIPTINSHSAGKHDRGFYTFYTIIPPLLFTPIYYLPPLRIYPHLLFTPIYYLPPFTIYPHLLLYPLYYFSGIKTHRKSFRRFIFSSEHFHLMSKMTGIKNSYVEIFKKFA